MVAAATAASAVATCYSYIMVTWLFCDGFPFRWPAVIGIRVVVCWFASCGIIENIARSSGEDM